MYIQIVITGRPKRVTWVTQDGRPSPLPYNVSRAAFLRDTRKLYHTRHSKLRSFAPKTLHRFTELNRVPTGAAPPARAETLLGSINMPENTRGHKEMCAVGFRVRGIRGSQFWSRTLVRRPLAFRSSDNGAF